MKPGLLMLPSAVSDSRVHNILPNKIETDFQFSRASSATRVNHQGLIENVGYFSDELVQNGNFSELGSELVTNGDFATDSDWTKGTGVTILNGKANWNNTGNNVGVTQNGIFTIGKTYKVEFTVSNYVGGTVRVRFPFIETRIQANGTYTFYGVATTDGLYLQGETQFGNPQFSIDNVSVKQVDPNDDWVINGEWEYVDNGVSITNATGAYNDSALYQLITLDSSKQYKATIDVSSISGSLRVYTGSFAAGFNISTAGEKSFILDLTSVGGRINLLPGNGSDVVIKSFSLVEVIGDKPRLDYDPTNPTCPHLLLEPQSTNLVTFSEDFSGYLNANIRIESNQIIAPDGVSKSSKLSKSTFFENIQSQATISNSTNYTFSVFVKQGTLNRITLRLASGSNDVRKCLDLSDLSVSDAAGNQTGFVSSKVERLVNDWYRFSITATSNGTTQFINIYAGKGNVVESGNVYIWGAMVEQQSYATSYIPTAGAAETRVGETCTNAGNVDTFNDAEGVLYCEIAALADDQTNRAITLSDGTTNNIAQILYASGASNKIRYIIRSGGVGGGNLDFSSTANNVTNYNKIALKYKLNDAQAWINGSKLSTDTSTNAPASLTRIDFLYSGVGNNFYGKVKGLATYNRALTDTELYTITSTQYSAYSGMVAALGNYTIPC